MKRLLAAGAAAAALLASGAAQAKHWSSVTIALEGAFAPWNLTRPDGTLDGFEPALAQNLCGRMHVTCKLVAQDWDGVIPALQAARVDVIMDALPVTLERWQPIDFSIPYANAPGAFAVKKSGPLADLPGTGTTIKLDAMPKPGSPAVAALRAALKGRTVGIQAACLYTKFIEDTFGDVATIHEYRSAPEYAAALMDGRIDAAFDDATAFVPVFAKAGDLAFAGPHIGGAIWGDGEALGLRKTDADLKTMFDTAIAAALADGTVRTLSVKWFGFDVSK
jgi:octopine/nopaline transport system substrate-binding protein